MVECLSLSLSLSVPLPSPLSLCLPLPLSMRLCPSAPTHRRVLIRVRGPRLLEQAQSGLRLRVDALRVEVEVPLREAVWAASDATTVASHAATAHSARAGIEHGNHRVERAQFERVLYHARLGAVAIVAGRLVRVEVPVRPLARLLAFEQSSSGCGRPVRVLAARSSRARAGGVEVSAILEVANDGLEDEKVVSVVLVAPRSGPPGRTAVLVLVLVLLLMLLFMVLVESLLISTL